jgi:4-diphosphocytidyl-2-C-methyl-D-erythritol kinase
VTGKRPDGYHNILSLMCRIGLWDEIRLRLVDGGIRLACSGAAVPADETNLAYRAAAAFFRELGRPAGVAVALAKNIPVAAGLGGGSSDAAGVLLGLNHLCGRPFTRARLMALGRGLGADVPFFIFQSPALASGIGDRLRRFEGLPDYRVLLVCPPVAVSTAQVYRNLNLRLTNCGKKITRDRLKNAAYSPARHACNDLEAVTLGLHPELAAIKERLTRLGAEGALMSGSGPSIFGLFPEAGAAEKAAARLPRDRGWRVIVTELLREPCELILAERAQR